MTTPSTHPSDYDELKLDCFAVLLPEVGSQFKWMKPGGEEHLVLWGLNRAKRIASFHVSYTTELRQLEWPYFWYAMARQILIPLQWR